LIENSILTSPDYLQRISADPSKITTGAFLIFLMAICCAGVGMALYPLMKKYSGFLAMAIVGFRVIEAMIQVIIAACQVSLLPLSQAATRVSTPNLAYYQTVGNAIKTGSDWLNNGAMLLCWCIAALMYYSIFYQNKLVPRWLTSWGLAGILMVMLPGVLVTLNLMPANGDLQTVVSLPIAVQEMVFAVWLIGKGLSTDEDTYRGELRQVRVSS
jgi:hypothetical protein